MIAEQLVSKELSQWRITKAKGISYMIVLPESDRLVKKTYNKEFQVEVDERDGAYRISCWWRMPSPS